MAIFQNFPGGGVNPDYRFVFIESSSDSASYPAYFILSSTKILHRCSNSAYTSLLVFYVLKETVLSDGTNSATLHPGTKYSILKLGGMGSNKAKLYETDTETVLLTEASAGSGFTIVS